MGGSDYTYARSACGIPPDGTVGLEYFPNLLLRLVARHYSYHAIHEIHNDHMPPDPSRRIATALGGCVAYGGYPTGAYNYPSGYYSA